MGFWGTMGTWGWALRGPGGQGTWEHRRGCRGTMETGSMGMWGCGDMGWGSEGTMGTGDMRTWDGALKGLWGQGVGFWGTMGTRGWALRGPGGQGDCEGRQGTGWGSWGATRNVGPRGCSSQGTSGTRRQPPPPRAPHAHLCPGSRQTRPPCRGPRRTRSAPRPQRPPPSSPPPAAAPGAVRGAAPQDAARGPRCGDTELRAAAAAR